MVFHPPDISCHERVEVGATYNARIARNVVDGNAGLGFGDNLGYWYCSVQLGKGFRFFDLGLRRSDCFCITDPDLQQGYSRGGEAEITFCLGNINRD